MRGSGFLSIGLDPHLFRSRCNMISSDHLFIRDKGSAKRFFNMIWKARLPYLWIGGYIVISVVLANIGINVTEYTAKMYAGHVAVRTVILPFVLLTLLNLGIGTVSGVLSLLCIARIDRNFRRMLWSKIVRLPLRFYEKNRPEELLSRITTDITTISQLVMQVFVAIITTGYSVVITLRKIGSYNGRLMTSLIVILPLNMVIAFIIGRMQFGIRDTINLRNAQLTQTIAERTSHAMLIKSMGNEEREFETGKSRMKALYSSNIVNAWITGFTSPLYAIVGAMQFIIIIMVGRGYYSSGALTLSQWIAYFGFANAIVNSLTTYCGYWTTLKGSQGATRRVAGVMQELEEKENEGLPVEKFCGDIAIKNIGFHYGDKTVFDGLSATIPEGRVTAIVGPSGSGKTTLLNLIDRLYCCEEGEISLGGRNISDYALKEYRESLSYITQESILFSGSIRENLTYGLRREVSNAELEEACRAVCIDELISKLPDGVETMVGEGGSTLSGGQRQRIAIARALLQKANYMLMDEATASMDIVGKDTIWQAIYQTMKGKTVVLVAHDCQTVLKADYLIVVENGRVTDQGVPEDVAQRSAYYQELIGKEA